MDKNIRTNLTGKEWKQISDKYNLIDFSFDNECIYKPGDLSNLLRYIVQQTLSELKIEISEHTSAANACYTATLKKDNCVITITTDVNSDCLSDDFIDKLEQLPVMFGSSKRFYPKIEFSQNVRYLCGTEENLRKARMEEGLPILLPGESMFDFLSRFE